MPQMQTAELPTTSRIALVLLWFLAIGPFVSGLDLWLRFMPEYPAFRHFYAASTFGHALWIGSSVLALAIIALIRQRQFIAAAVVSVPYGVTSAIGAAIVWGQATFRPLFLISVFVLCVASAVIARRNAPTIGDPAP